MFLEKSLAGNIKWKDRYSLAISWAQLCLRPT